MLDEPGILPFHINLPLCKAYGLLRLDSQVVVMEFQLIDRWLGMLRTGVRTLHLPYLELMGAELQKNWTGSRSLVLRASSLHPLRRVPGSLQGHCWLHIQRAHRPQAEIFYNALLLKLSEYHLERLSQAFDDDPLRLEPSWNERIRRLIQPGK
ncbi:MAG: hypothetical protein CVV27_08175 [Candidatus Melainabacteria bacterium HGW-Melainabacteria-1]|nr:MAG: hypothetical protein CVV27_08175 [Candidatus Melainabacteria bacterium HGW-Melainabacteria-1]